ncbi:MAG: hypothetical protein V4603_13940 [Pseudomonadota bacterium]
MVKPNLTFLAVMLTSALTAETVLAQGGSQSQAGGLPALAKEVAELRALVNNLQAQVNAGSDDPYVGNYAVTLTETSIFACGANTFPVQGPQFNLFAYLQGQAISSISTRSATIDAVSDGTVLSIADHELFTHELRLRGSYEYNFRVEEGFDVDIAADGSLSIQFEADATLNGQFSDDGSVFSMTVQGIFDDGTNPNCTDAFTVTATGVRK